MRILRDRFDQLLEAELAALPPQFAKWLDEVPLIVEDDPPEELLAELGVDEDGDLLGSYNGVAITRRSVDDPARAPDHIYLFRRPLLSLCDTEAELSREIRVTLLHELGHYAGFGEDDLKRMGYE